MDVFAMDIRRIEGYKENNRLEAVLSQNGLPRSIWETYSSFANTSGGVIVLGAEEDGNGDLHVAGVDNPEKLKSDFFNLLNDTNKVSRNILSEKDVRIESIEGKNVLVINVPRASRGQRPIYIGGNSDNGTFKRNNEGDYHCDSDEIAAMFAEREGNLGDSSLVSRALGFDDLSFDTISSYRGFFRSLRPSHPWNELNDKDFLLRLGAVKIEEDEMKLTEAGLLFFGQDWIILQEFPKYFLDYQFWGKGETERWLNRIESGLAEWSGNLFDFYLLVSQDLFARLPSPFAIDPSSMQRQDDTPARKAVREILINAISNADYHVESGISIVFKDNRIVASNPGRMLLDPKKALNGGTSLPRNETIFRMFNLLGLGDRSGWGIPYLNSFALDYSGEEIMIEESVQPDKTVITIPFYENKIVRTITFESFLEGKKKGQSFSREEMESSVSLSPSGLTNKINRALSQGVIARLDKRGWFIKL
ncbi:MAG: putative DNA binding domain-containing protein [Bacilli bacterium]|nr:putative DNA binding domain-containing protein [Bacilli bacterium]